MQLAMGRDNNMLEAGSYHAPTPPDLEVQEDDIFVFPASFAQRRLWFLDQWEPGVYIIPLAIGLVGSMNLSAMERALQDIVQRHEALRTTFKMVESELVQVVVSHMPFSLPLIELHHFAEDVRLVKLRRLVKEEFHRPFDLQRGPLLRATMVKLEDHYHAMLLSMHHIVSDAWSMEIFFRELTNTYSSYVTGEPQELPELALQYPDYAIWQQEWLQGEVLENHLTYWKEQLADMPLLQLPFDHPRPAVQGFRAQPRIVVLPRPLGDALKALSRREGTTLFMTLLAAFKTILYRYAQQESIVVGIPIAGRTDSRLEGVIGCFINTLALRTDLSGNPTFRELLTRVREVTLGAYAHQDLPFEMLVETLQPERDLSRNPLTQVMFALQNVPKGQIHMAGLTLSPVKLDSETSMITRGDATRLGKEQNTLVDNEPAMFDLDLTMWERGKEIVGELKYNTDLFDASTIERFQTHFQRLLEAIVANPGQRINDLPLLSDHERTQQLVEWNDTAAPYPLDLCYTDLFAEQVERTPAAPAVTCEGETLNYAELDRRANRLAHHLQRQGIGPDSLVALLDTRGIPFLVAMLAVFKAGAAYLPLDPLHPAARQRQILTHSGCRLVLVGSAFTASIEEVIEGIDLAVRPSWLVLDAQYEAEPETLPQRASISHHLAYVIYTSGSTGQPKGAMIEQQGMLNHLFAKIEALDLGPEDCVAQTASQCFDISVWQFLAALLVGGSIQIIPTEQAHDPRRLLNSVEAGRVSILETVPSLLQALVEIYEDTGRERPALETLRWLILTGEVLSPHLCRAWLALYPAIPLLNAYGPTECSDDVTHQAIDQAPGSRASSIAIGRPVPNMRLYILDRDMQPVPPGVSGELYVGGVGVGRGYLGDPRRTAEAFVPDPFGPVEGGRLYRTGDLARFQADGTIDFQGRIDFQVKIRGYRIELGEIEATLLRHPAVQQSVVVAPASASANAFLLAYIVLRQGQEATSTELLRHLKESLPDYMLPASCLILPALPLTANGKIDRKALPMPERILTELDTNYVAPATPTEQRLACIWSEILGQERIGIQDDFFTIGGHSLLAVRLMMQIEKQFEQHLPLEAIFQWRTIAAQAEILDRPAQVSAWSPVANGSSEQINLRSEAILELEDCPEVWPRDLTTEPARIFLTGATGFLGTFLLADLLRQTTADIYCLVRSNNALEGHRKIQRYLVQALLWQDEFATRIKPVVGDLALPQLGLSPETFDELCATLDSIYHNGAMVSMIHPYQEHKAANVQGTREIIRLASHGKIKPLHYVSTLSVFTHKGAEPVLTIREQESIDDYAEQLKGGYDQSKWVAEKLVQTARSRGLPVAIYRPGRFTGHSQSGVWRPEDLLCRMIKGCIQLGSSPLLVLDEKMEMTPVDYVSQAIVALSRRRASYGQAFHLFNAVPMMVNEMITWTNEAGFSLKLLPYNEWRASLAATLDEGVENELAPIAPLLFPLQRIDGPLQAPATQVVYEDRHTRAALANVSVHCPAGDGVLYKTYLSYMVKSGYLPAPDGKNLEG